MKKIMVLVWSIIMIFTLAACSVRFEVRNKRSNASLSSENIDINKSVIFEGESQIDIEIGYGKVALIGYEGNEVVVSGTTNISDDKLIVSKKGDTIKIEDESEHLIDLSRDNDYRLDLEIKIPYSFNGDLNYEYGAGESEIKDIICNNLNIDGGTGELTVDDIVFNKLDFSAGIGKSDINLIRKCGDINIDGGVGEVNVSLAEVGGNMVFEGGVGSATIKIPENSPVYFNTTSGIGNTDINARISSEKTYEFKLSVGIGEIKVFN